MAEFLLELYVSHSDAAAVERDAASARRAADELSLQGTDVRFVRSIFVPDDETCFLLFDAPSTAAVRAAAERAELPVDRIVAAW
jgi:hypothetical protein